MSIEDTVCTTNGAGNLGNFNPTLLRGKPDPKFCVMRFKVVQQQLRMMKDLKCSIRRTLALTEPSTLEIRSPVQMPLPGWRANFDIY